MSTDDPTPHTPGTPPPPSGPDYGTPIGTPGTPPANPYGMPQGEYGGYGTPPPPPGGGDAFPRATWGPRALGYVIDVLAPSLLAGILNSIDSTLGLIAYLALIAWLIYNYGVKQGQTGYTVGKGIAGIRLVSQETGQPVGVGLAIARYFVHILDALPCYLGFLWPLWDKRHETFADKILKHAVVVAPKRSASEVLGR